MAAKAFKPTHAEIRRVQYLARETIVDTGATQRLAALGQRHWYGMHRPAERAAEAFSLARLVAKRSQSGGPL